MKNKLLTLIFLLVSPSIIFNMETELSPFDDYLSEEIGDVYSIKHPEIEEEEMEDMNIEYPEESTYPKYGEIEEGGMED